MVPHGATGQLTSAPMANVAAGTTGTTGISDGPSDRGRPARQWDALIAAHTSPQKATRNTSIAAFACATWVPPRAAELLKAIPYLIVSRCPDPWSISRDFKVLVWP